METHCVATKWSMKVLIHVRNYHTGRKTANMERNRRNSGELRRTEVETEEGEYATQKIVNCEL